MRLRNSHTLILDAGHGEYMPYAEGVSITDIHYLNDDRYWGAERPPTDEEAQSLLNKHLPREALGMEVYDPAWCLVITMTGTFEDLLQAFYDLLKQVAEEPSGDDTTFDYWPSGARLLLQLAADLDELRGPSGMSWGETARDVIGEVLEAKGDLAEELTDKIPALS